MNPGKIRTASAVLVGLLLAGCEVGPNYQQPKVELPKSYSVPTTQPAASIAWWETFNDPILNQLETEVRHSNWDLRSAESRIAEARAQRRYNASNYYPMINSDGSYARAHSSHNVSGGSANTGAVGGSSGSGIGGDHNLWQAGFDATWEIDVFGGVRRSVEAADAAVDSAVWNRNDVLLTLLGEIARDYVDLRGAQSQISIAQDNIRAQQQTLDLTKARVNAGISTDLDVAQQQAQVASTQAEIPTLQVRAEEDIHALAVLVAKPPAALEDLLASVKPLPPAPPAIPVGMPIDLIRRRPDIRIAERNLAAATANIGVATAQLYPRFTLNGSLGQQSLHFSNLFDSSSTFWSLGPGVTLPIFNGGQLRANIDVFKARADQSLATYQQTVLNSLQEVEDDLVAYQKEFVRHESLAQAVSANRRSLNLSQQLYQRGLTNFLNVLDAERALYSSQDQLAQSDTTVSANAVALFKALGGGWEVDQKTKQD